MLFSMCGDIGHEVEYCRKEKRYFGDRQTDRHRELNLNLAPALRGGAPRPQFCHLQNGGNNNDTSLGQLQDLNKAAWWKGTNTDPGTLESSDRWCRARQKGRHLMNICWTKVRRLIPSHRLLTTDPTSNCLLCCSWPYRIGGSGLVTVVMSTLYTLML